MSAIRLDSTSELLLKANDIRVDIIKMLLEAKSGHSGGPLGMTDIFTALYFNVLRHDPQKPQWAERDRVFLSNGHICPVLYATLANAGYFDKSKLSTLRKFGSGLQGHPHRGSLPGIDNSSGPLGQGISLACGQALAARMKKQEFVCFCSMGDGELDEGQCWEAFMLAVKYKLGRLVIIVDCNKIQIDGNVEDVMPLEPLAGKFSAFGLRVVEFDGNDMAAALAVLREARQYAAANPQGRPTVLIAKTVPGKGVSFMENKYQWHGKTPNSEEAKQALSELEAQRKKIESA